jgi:hypothetical protein
VVLVLWPQAETRTLRQPQTAAFGLLLRALQPLTPLDPLHPLVVDPPARIPQQSCNLAVAIPAILGRQLDDIGGQLPLVVAASWELALRRAVLPERRTGPALRAIQTITNMLDAGAATCGA